MGQQTAIAAIVCLVLLAGLGNVLAPYTKMAGSSGPCRPFLLGGGGGRVGGGGGAAAAIGGSAAAAVAAASAAATATATTTTRANDDPSTAILVGPVLRYPTPKTKAPCTHPSIDVKLTPLKCYRVLDKTVGFLDPYSIALTYGSDGFWPMTLIGDGINSSNNNTPNTTNCTHVDVWIVHYVLLTSPLLPTAIKALPNVPSFIAVDHSGEIGDLEICNCVFNELTKEYLFENGWSRVTFTLVSQASSVDQLGHRLYNQHWRVPREIAALESAAAAASAAAVAANQSSSNPSTADGFNNTSLANTAVAPARILCLGGYPRPHKAQFLAELDARGILDRQGFAWSAGTPNPDWFGPRLGPNLKYHGYTDDEVARADAFQHKLPHVLDMDRGAQKASSLSYMAGLYSSAPLHIVVESSSDIPALDRRPSCSRRFRYTEKTLKAMYARARFVIFGAPGVLQLLRDHGFQTFHPHINETYDAIPTYKEKVEALRVETERLLSLSDKEFQALLAKTQPVVDHNRQWLLSDAFADNVYRQSLYAFGLTTTFSTMTPTMATPTIGPAFDSPNHKALIGRMYQSIGMNCA